MKNLKDYEINGKTLALVPLNNKTRVYEKGKTFIVDKSTYQVMEDSCQYFGSSLQGRQKGTTNLTGITHKAPIIVEESRDIIFFPTASPKGGKCAWISLNNLENYEELEDEVKLVFTKDDVLNVNVSYGIIDNQVLRATKLESALRKRKSKDKNF